MVKVNTPTVLNAEVNEANEEHTLPTPSSSGPPYHSQNFPIPSFAYQNVLACLHLSSKWAVSLSMSMQPGSHGARACGSAGSRLAGIYLNL